MDFGGKLPYDEFIKTEEYKQEQIRKKLWDIENDCPKGGWKVKEKYTPPDPALADLNHKKRALIENLRDINRLIGSYMSSYNLNQVHIEDKRTDDFISELSALWPGVSLDAVLDHEKFKK